MRLIDADALLKDGIRVQCGYDADGLLMIPLRDVTKSIKDAPTVDAAPVVRCKDCKWRNTKGCPYENFAAAARADDDFCSDGERRNNGNL